MSSFNAHDLTGAHIGKRVRFMRVEKGPKVEMIITGELLSIAHAKDHVRVELGNKYSQASVVERLEVLQTVIVDPDTSKVENIPALRPDSR